MNVMYPDTTRETKHIMNIVYFMFATPFLRFYSR
jgi:hypothetical protein